MTQATAGRAGLAGKTRGAIGPRPSGRASGGCESAPIAERTSEANRHSKGVCLMKRLIRRRRLEDEDTGKPRQLVVSV